MILCVGRLRDFFLWRSCVIFFTHSLRLLDLFFWRLHDFFCGEIACFFLERLHGLFYGELA